MAQPQWAALAAAHQNFSETNLVSVTAEEVGFEPTVPFDTAVFKTAALDHYATPPKRYEAVGGPDNDTSSTSFRNRNQMR